MKTLWVLIGPSVSGKSTIAEKIVKNSTEIVDTFSWDELRLRWYDQTDYKNAWELSCQDRSFKARADKEFQEMLATGNDIIVDNTNLTVKRRKFFIREAKNHGYTTIGVTFDVPLHVLVERQMTRGDKCVPTDSVIKQFKSFTFPILNEFDILLKSTDVK